MSDSRVVVRPAAAGDLPALGRMAGALVRLHHGFDARRFMLVDGVEEGYARFFASQLGQRDLVLLVADERAPGADATRLLGYVYARNEGRDWNLLLDAHGALHDLWVEPAARRRGVAGALLDAAVAALTALGAQRVVLSTATQNTAAQALFERHGFAVTMLEMTREIA